MQNFKSAFKHNLFSLVGEL